MAKARRQKKSPRVLVLAGLDPSGRAGLLADGEAVQACGARPILCATAITAQSSGRLICQEAVSITMLRSQVEASLEDGEIGAVKLGMLGTPAVVETLVELLSGPLAQVPVVVDPVWQSSSHGRLFSGTSEDYWPLIARAQLVTPNLGEAELLSGMELSDEVLMHEAASRIVLRGARAVLIKGGHLAGSPVDLLMDGEDAFWFRGPRIKAQKRGTGCRLASAVAAGLAAECSLKDSVEQAILYVRKYLRKSG